MPAERPIAVDAMGGDLMPGAAVAGALQAAGEGHQVVLVGDAARLRAELDGRGADLPVVHAPDLITMADSATDVRRRPEASVVVGMRLVREGEASACISMGHSGATMAAALLLLGRVRGVDRPAILATIPVASGGASLLIDAGANADARPAFLQQFALMGSIYAVSVLGRADPSVGLMSIGEEPEKGNELTRAAHQLIRQTPGLNFRGNVEGRDLLFGTTDVVVTDGFTGNVMLKLAEGEARAIFSMVRTALRGSLRARLGALLARPALRSVAARLDPAEVGAQPLLGVNGSAFIGHGSSDGRAVASAVRTAARMVAAGVTEGLALRLEALKAPPDVAGRR